MRHWQAWRRFSSGVVLIFVALGLVACTGGGTPAAPTAAPAAKPTAAAKQAAAEQHKYDEEHTKYSYTQLPWPDKKPKYGGTLNLIGSGTNPVPDFNPFRSYNSELTIPCDSLLSQDLGITSKVDPTKRVNAERLTVIPMLAKSWKMENDTTYVLSLQQGVRFFNIPPVNGREFTADDAKASLEAYKASPAWSALFEMVDTVEAPDKYTLRITTKGPFAPLINYLSWPHMMMMPRELIEQPDLMKTTLICTGPFTVGEYQPNVSITYTRNPNYWLHDPKYPENQLPYVDAVKITRMLDLNAQKAAFRTGQVDSIRPTVPSQMEEILKTNPDTVVQVSPPSPTAQFHLAFRLDQKPFDDIRVRRAISMAIDRKALWKNVGEDFFGAPSPVAYFDMGLDQPRTLEEMGQWYQYNPEAAKKLMTEAGVADGFKTSVQSFFPGTGPENDMLQLVQAQLKKNLNVDLEISTPERNTILNAMFGKKWDGLIYTFFVLGGGSSTDVDDFTWGMYNSKSSRNFGGYSNPKMDQLTDEQRAVTTDPQKRADIVKQIVALEQDELPRIWIAGAWNYEAWQPWVREASHNIVFWYAPAAGASITRYNWIDK